MPTRSGLEISHQKKATLKVTRSNLDHIHKSSGKFKPNPPRLIRTPKIESIHNLTLWQILPRIRTTIITQQERPHRLRDALATYERAIDKLLITGVADGSIRRVHVPENLLPRYDELLSLKAAGTLPPIPEPRISTQ